MNELNLVKNINGEVYTDSKLIADTFGKQHKHVLETIKSISAEISDESLFIESTYKSKRGDVKCYLVSETGLQLYLFNIQGFVQEKLEYINQFNAMKQMIVDLQLGKPEAIISLLTWKNSNMETTLRAYVNGGNVLNVIPAILEECKKQVETGSMKIEVISTVIRTLEDMRDNESIIGNRDNYATAILNANHKLRSIQNGTLGGITASNNNLKKQLELKEKEVEQAETKRLKDFSDKALIKAYKESGIIGDLVDDHVKCVMDDELYKLFVENLENIIRQIVKHSGNDYRAAHMMVYNRMGIHSKGRFNSYTEYIFYNQWEMKCLQVAADILEKYL